MTASNKGNIVRTNLGAPSLIIAAIVVVIAALGSIWTIPALGSKTHETTLQEAMAQPHGAAHGDQAHPTAHEDHKGVDPGAGAVNDGRKGQATAITLRPDLHPIQPGQLYAKGDYSAGCTIGYGRGKACLPVTPPSAGAMEMSVKAMPWTCMEVRTLLPKGIAVDVRGVDPARLDRNGDGIACDPTD